jgi:hypothetical protein
MVFFFFFLALELGSGSAQARRVIGIIDSGLASLETPSLQKPKFQHFLKVLIH